MGFEGEEVGRVQTGKVGLERMLVMDGLHHDCGS